MPLPSSRERMQPHTSRLISGLKNLFEKISLAYENQNRR